TWCGRKLRYKRTTEAQRAQRKAHRECDESRGLHANQHSSDCFLSVPSSVLSVPLWFVLPIRRIGVFLTPSRLMFALLLIGITALGAAGQDVEKPQPKEKGLPEAAKEAMARTLQKAEEEYRTLTKKPET